MSANDMKLHAEEIYAAAWEWYPGPNSRQRVCVCVRAWVCICIFFSPPYGCDLVICYSMLAYSHTSGFPLLCGFLVCVDKMYFGEGQNLSGCCLRPVIKPSVLSICRSRWFQTCDILDGPVTWQNVLVVIDLLTCSTWVCLVTTRVPDVITFRGSVDSWLRRYRGELRTQLKLGQRPFDVWCHLQSFARLCALLDCFRGRGWALARTAVVWLSSEVPNWHYWGKY